MRRQWLSGDPAPDFIARSTSSPRYHFDTAAGRYIVITFFGSMSHAPAAEVVRHLQTTKRALFNDIKAAFFGVSIDPVDEKEGRVKQSMPGYRYFWDDDLSLSKLYGAIEDDTAKPGPSVAYHPFTLVLDPLQRVLAYVPLNDANAHIATLDGVLNSLPEVPDYAGVPIHAPVLILPRVFEPKFCADLIGEYAKQGGQDSGFMREVEGKTVGILDHTFKRRKDFTFDSQPEFDQLRNAIRARINRRLVPEVHKAFQFTVSRMERYLIACYEGEDGGFFRAHRDNTTTGTAHRRFACTLNLNAEDYEGGDLRFPEFGPQTYRAPTGGAVVFSCSLLHEATPVTKGTRYAFLPFLYDEEAAKIREKNRSAITGTTIDKNAEQSEYTLASD